MKTSKKETKNALSYNEVIPHYISEGDMLAVKLDYKRFDTGSKLGFVEANINFALKDAEIKKDLLNYLKKLVK